MSKHFFTRLVQGYNGIKSAGTLKYYANNNITCALPECNELKTQYKGIGSNMCEAHQKRMRDYGGPARQDRPYTFHKKDFCESCGHDPWKHPLVKKISDELIRDRVANGMLIVDHKTTQRDGGGHGADNVQTLCLDCNQIKTTLACDSMPAKLYKDPEAIQKLQDKLRPYYDAIFS
jgi:5-methylcytosine-specific restriction endonuclease McrA